MERKQYKLQCSQSREDLKRIFTFPDSNYCPRLTGSLFSPCSLDITVHISFNFAQQVHCPCNPLQPGLTLRRYQKSISSINSYFQQIIQERSIICKLYSDSEETKLDMCVNPLWQPSISDFPPVVLPRGLSPERQLYLYEKIRPFCTDRSMDLTCPIPSNHPQASTTSATIPITSRAIPSSHYPS